MLKKIKYKIRFSLFLLIIKASLSLKFPKLTALALAIMVDPINDRGNFTVLCFGRSVFLNDVMALAAFGRQIKYLVISKEYFGIIFHNFFDKFDLIQLSEKTYHSADFCREGKKEYNSYLFRVLPTLQRLLKFDAILSGNFGYQEQQELEDVCAKQKIPFIVLHKEGLITPGSESGWASVYAAYKFRGARALFYNERMLNIYRGISFSGVTKKNSVVVGMPRLDFYFSMVKEKPPRKRVLFFSFYSDDKMQWLTGGGENKVQQIRQRSHDFHKWVIGFAVEHPDIPVTIKTKMSSHYLQYVQGIIKNDFQQSMPPGLTVINFGQVSDLIRNASVIISFNSSTCLKAIAADRFLISPYFGDLFSDKSWDYFGEFPELVNYAKTEKDLTELVMNSALPVPDNQRQKIKTAFLKDLVFNSDGQASRRAEQEIINTIQEYKFRN